MELTSRFVGALDELVEELDRWIAYAAEAVHAAEARQRIAAERVRRSETTMALVHDALDSEVAEFDRRPDTCAELADDIESMRRRLHDRRTEIGHLALDVEDVHRQLGARLEQVGAWAAVADQTLADQLAAEQRARGALTANERIIQTLNESGRRGRHLREPMEAALAAFAAAQSDLGRAEQSVQVATENCAHLRRRQAALSVAIDDAVALATTLRERETDLVNGLHALQLAAELVDAAGAALDRAAVARSGVEDHVTEIRRAHEGCSAHQAEGGRRLAHVQSLYEMVQTTASDLLGELRDVVPSPRSAERPS